jgi:hypothetical protein
MTRSVGGNYSQIDLFALRDIFSQFYGQILKGGGCLIPNRSEDVSFFAQFKVRLYLLDSVAIIRIGRTNLNDLCEGGSYKQ